MLNSLFSNTVQPWTHRLYQLDALREIAHEGESADALGKPRDLAKAHHEAVLLAELVQGPALALVVVDELHFILCGDETLQQLEEVQALSFQVVPAGKVHVLNIKCLFNIFRFSFYCRIIQLMHKQGLTHTSQ